MYYIVESRIMENDTATAFYTFTRFMHSKYIAHIQHSTSIARFSTAHHSLKAINSTY